MKKPFQTLASKLQSLLPKLLVVSALASASTAQAGSTFTTAGNTTWTCPANVYTVQVQAVGGGGGGGSSTQNYGCGGGGAGGSYVEYTVNVVPGTVYNLTVGAGGAYGTNTVNSAIGGTGGSSYFGNTTAGNSTGSVVLAVGGPGGFGATTLGVSTNRTGNIAGGTGTTSGNIPATGATADVAGTNGGTSIGGATGTAKSGAGGAGAAPLGGAGGAAVVSATTSQSGNNGIAPGGGGSGDANYTLNTKIGGTGGAGEILLTYATNLNVAGSSTVTANPTSVAADGSTTSTITVTLQDASANPLVGKTISLASNRGSSADTISPASAATSSSGVATFTVKSAVGGSAVLTATDTTDSLTISQTATVTFVSGVSIDHFTVMPSTLSATAGQPFTATVQAYTTSGPITGNSADGITVLMTSSGAAQFDANGDGVYGDNLKPLTNGTFTIAVEDFKAESMTLTASVGTATGTTAAIAVAPNAAAQLQLLLPGESAAPGTTTGKTGTPAVQTAGTPFTVVLNEVDTNWNVVSSTDTIHLSATGDANALLPANTSLVAGTKTLTVTDILAPGSKTLTASDVSSGSIAAGTSAAYSVVPGAVSRLLAIAPGETPTFGTAPGKTGTTSSEYPTVGYSVTAYALDAEYNLVTNSGDVVAITSSDTTATLPAAAALAGGAKTFAITNGAPGTFSLIATNISEGTAVATGSSTVTVIKITTATSLAASVNPANAGESVTFTATISGPGVHTGTVAFSANGTVLGTGTVSGTSASFTTSGGVGTNALTATYSGDANNLGSTSAPLTEIIQPGVVASAAEMEEGFDYPLITASMPIGDPVPSLGVWQCSSDSSANTAVTGNALILAGDITSTNVPPLQPLPNQTNVAAHLWMNKGATDREMLRSIGNAISSGSAYFSFIVSNSVNPSTTGAPMVTMLASNVNNAPLGNDPVTLYGRKGADSTHYNLGIQRLGGTISWAAASLPTATPNLVVLQYTFGGSDDLYINPTPGGAPPTPDAVATSGTNSEPANIGTILFYESGTPLPLSDGTWNYDVMRADASWYNVTPPIGASGLGAASLAITSLPQTFSINDGSGLMTVTLEDQSNNVFTATANTVVSLTTSSTGGTFLSGSDDATVITNIVIAAGTSSATFYYNDSIAGFPVITAASGLLTSGKQTETVNPPAGLLSYFTVTPSASTTAAGTVFTATVQAYGSNNVPILNHTLDGIIVTMSSSGLAKFDANGDGVYGDNTKPLTNGTMTINVTDAKAESLTLTAAVGTNSGTSSAITITPDAVAQLQVLLPGESAAPGTISGKTGLPMPEMAGTPFSITVNAVDTNWNVSATSDSIQITAAGDASARVPGIKALAAGTATFTVTNIQAGSGRSLTATDVSNGGITPATSTSYTVVPGPATQLLVLAPGETATFGTAPGKIGVPSHELQVSSYPLTVYALDAEYNLATNNSDLVQITSTDGAAFVPANATLTGGTATFAFANNAGGTVTDTAADLSNSSVTPGSTTLTIDLIARFESVSSGNWNAVTNWVYSTDGGNTWSPATTTPSSSITALVLVTNGVSLNVSAGLAITRTTVAAGSSVTVPAGVTLSVVDEPGTDLNVYGVVTNAGTITVVSPATAKMNNGSVYYHNEDGGSLLTADWDTNSTCDIIGWKTGTAVTTTTGLQQSFGNFTWASPGQTSTLSMGGAPPVTINGNFNVLSTGSGILAICLAANVNLSIGGDVNLEGGTVYGGDAGPGTEIVSVGGNLNISGGVLDLESDGPGAEIVTWNLHGNLNLAGGTLTGVATNDLPTIAFVKAGRQVVSVAGGSVPASSTIAWTVASNSIVDLGTSSLAGAEGFTNTYGGTLITASPSGFSGNLNFPAAKLALGLTGGNYTYDGQTAQSGDTVLPATVANLTINNPNGVTLSRAETVTNLTLNGSLLAGTVTLAGSGAFTVTGSNSTINGSVAVNTASLVLVSSNTFPVLTVETGTLSLSSGPVQFDELGSILPEGNYLMVNAQAGGSVTGTPALSATGTGLLAGLIGTPEIASGNLYLKVVAFYPAYDAGAGFFGGENLVLTNSSGLSLYAWSSANPSTPVSGWTSEGALQETPFNDGSGNSRYAINVNPYASPTYYVVGTTNGGPYLVSPVPVESLTTPDYVTFTVTNSLAAISLAGVLDLVPAPVFSGSGTYAAGVGFQLQFSGVSGQGYSILASTNLTTWTVIGTGTFGASPVSFTDTNAVNVPLEFYRISVP